MRPIDADALVEHLERMSNNYTEIYERFKGDDRIKAVIYGKFTAIVETMIDVKRTSTLDYAPVRHGEWVKQKNGRLLCSECGVRGLQDSDELDYYYYPSDYCPSCGAKMDGGKEDAHDP